VLKPNRIAKPSSRGDSKLTLLGYSDSLANLNITIPTNLSNANALQEIAQVSAKLR